MNGHHSVSAWWVALGLALGVTVSNGFARFAYGLILPAMRADLGWTYAEAGWINTANALGYIGGALLTLTLIRRIGPVRLYVIGMICTSVSLLLSGITDDFVFLTVWRITSGIAGAPVFISGGILAATLFSDPKKTALAIALYFGGGGVGMVLTGATIPTIFALHGAPVWPIVWVGLGGASVLFSFLAIWATSFLHLPDKVAQTQPAQTIPIRTLIKLTLYALIGYGLFATGYIVYVTFLVAWMVDISAGPELVSVTWVAIGLAIIVSPFAWKTILARFSNGVPLAMAIGVTAAGTLLPLLFSGPVSIILSGTLFGIGVFIAPAAITAFSRYNLPSEIQGTAVALFTTTFAIGQTIGPIAAGAVADTFNSIEKGLLAAGIVLGIGAITALGQRSGAKHLQSSQSRVVSEPPFQ
ncbi:YbfB/YjiJ family MFS transporter [Ruegeria atlantica]|uniref:YbfB/YjiJ family MFS transporter n=1 Tax=Ruegeria atlantica TaxID=81569 RepID=UPI00147BA082